MITLQDVQALDRADKLAHKRDEFVLPEGVVYMDGNSLGVLPKVVMPAVEDLVSRQWGQDLISSWNKHDWIDLPVTTGEKIARLIGADLGQVVCCDSISVNLFKLLASALHLNSGRQVILSQQDNFPTDLYMAQGLRSLLGSKRCVLHQVASDQLEQSINDEVAVLLLTQVDFRSGYKHDIRHLTSIAHQHGVLVIWDLAHSAGALPLDMDIDHVDFAVGCGYKYLNGGPGAPAFCYVAKRHQSELMQPLSGWMGHRAPFAFEPQYHAANGIEQLLAGTPNILSLTALDTALDVFEGVAMSELHQKSIALSELFCKLIDACSELSDLVNISPKDPNARGSQIALTHPNAYELSQALIDKKVVVDFRAPNIVRFGFTPLYLRFEDVWLAVERLREIVSNKTYLKDTYGQRNKVT